MKKLSISILILFLLFLLIPPLPVMAYDSSTDMVDFVEREKVFEQTKFPDLEQEDKIGPGYKIGTFKEDAYKGYDFVFAFCSISMPCKGAPCPFAHVRFAMKDNQLVYFPKISLKYDIGDSYIISMFRKCGFEVIEDNSFTIPALEYPIMIKGPKKGQVLCSDYDSSQRDWDLSEKAYYGDLDLNKFKKVFYDKQLGDIYTAPLNETISVNYITKWGNPSKYTFEGNKFYAFRPDQTLFCYYFNPNFINEKIEWNDKIETIEKEQKWQYSLAFSPCGNRADYDVVSPSSINIKADLKKAGKTESGDTIYTLKDAEHQILKTVYERYHNDYLEDSEYIHTPLKTFEQFINSRPIIFWKDPFDRLIWALNKDFKAPCMAEPIIYLYPTVLTKITIKFPEKLNITASEPVYTDHWEVLAKPSGELEHLSDGKIYSRLFWEGWSHLLDSPERGFVVKKEEVKAFLNKTLPKLGLNTFETKEFLEAWLPRFSIAPYYFITFIDPSIINNLAPLDIFPKPDTVIRILMDYQPLEEPIEVEPLEIPEMKKRKGFTFIEWGGLTR